LTDVVALASLPNSIGQLKRYRRMIHTNPLHHEY
jgi:hypothetical protein